MQPSGVTEQATHNLLHASCTPLIVVYQSRSQSPECHNGLHHFLAFGTQDRAIWVLGTTKIHAHSRSACSHTSLPNQGSRGRCSKPLTYFTKSPVYCPNNTHPSTQLTPKHQPNSTCTTQQYAARLCRLNRCWGCLHSHCFCFCWWHLCHDDLLNVVHGQVSCHVIGAEARAHCKRCHAVHRHWDALLGWEGGVLDADGQGGGLEGHALIPAVGGWSNTQSALALNMSVIRVHGRGWMSKRQRQAVLNSK